MVLPPCVSLASKRRLSWVAISLLQFALYSLANFQAALSQNTNFTFDNFRNIDQPILLNDALQDTDAVFLNAVGTAGERNTCGKALFKETVRLLDTKSSRESAVASFSTVFTFSIKRLNLLANAYYDLVCQASGAGLAFSFSVDNIREATLGGSLCTIREEDDGKSTNHMFAVECNVIAPFFPLVHDPSNNHVGVNLCGGEKDVKCTYLVFGSTTWRQPYPGSSPGQWIHYTGCEEATESVAACL